MLRADSPMPPSEKLSAIRRAAARAETRMRLGRVIAALPTSLTLALTASGAMLAAHKIWPEQVVASWAWSVIGGAALSVAATALVSWFRALPPHAGALALDKHHGLYGRLTNAIELSAVEEAARSPMMRAAIEDACGAPALEPRRAVQLMWPPELWVSAAVAAGVALVALLEVPFERELPPPPMAAAFEPLEIAPDDLALFKEAVAELSREEQSPEVKEAIERFNQLVTDIAERRLNRTEAFRKMQEIESDLLQGAEADKKALDEALKDTAKELDKSPMSKPIADALQKEDLKKAAEEARKLAEQLKDDKHKTSKEELERLKKALERAAQDKRKALEEINEQRAALRQDLLNKKNEDENKQPKSKEEQDREKDLLKKKKRELERLDREAKQKENALRRLNKLDRDLAKAAADLMRELGASAEDMQQVAEDIERLQQEQMSDKEKEELRKRIEEMRDLIRQQGQGGEQMRQRLQRFLKRARGGSQQGGGKQGEGKDGQGQRPGDGKDGQDGQGKDGQGKGMGEGKGAGEGLVFGPGGQPIPVDMPGGSGEQPGGEGDGKGGQTYGSGKGGDPKGEHSDIDGQNVDVRADAIDTQQGPTNAEVILSAADRGFTGKPYKQVYKEYRTVAEDQIDTEKIPDGMRFYVRRYFQLIRPRE